MYDFDERFVSAEFQWSGHEACGWKNRDFDALSECRATNSGSCHLNRMASATVLFFMAWLPNASTVNAELATSFQQVGNLGMEVAAVAGGNTLITGGTLTLNDLPATATIVRATLYASQVDNPNGQAARFAGVDLGIVAPYDSDPGVLSFYTYTWDVTALVSPGTDAYTFRVGGAPDGSLVAGVALLVVWHDWSEPTRIVTINDGMDQLGNGGSETVGTTFDNLGDGETEVWLFTILDDAFNTGETIQYNGILIGGPIDQNLGPIASLMHLQSASVPGTNALSVLTGFDHMGWMIAATAVTVPAVPVSDTTWQQVKELYR